MNAALSNVPTLLQSHWDKLPEEIQCHVISLATWQHILDRRNNELLNDLHGQILDYAQLKREWGRGHIEIRYVKCNLDVCKPNYGSRLHHMIIRGVDDHNNKRKIYLGYNFHSALRDVNTDYGD